MLAIRDVEDPDDFKQCAEIQRQVWGCATDHFIVTAAMLQACRRHGGIVLGAFDAQGSLAGFTFTFPALWEGRRIQHSHMLAMLPAYRDAGGGRLLKQAQRARLLGVVPLITWTFDPLESKNAHINLNRLGGVIRRYYRDLYGHHTASPLHEGIGTDRFLLELYLKETADRETSPWLEAVDTSGLPRALKVRRQGERWLPVELDLGLTQPRILVEIPTNIQRLKSADAPAAALWRRFTRAALEEYLARGGEIRQLVRLEAEGSRPARSFYLLTQAAA